MNRLFQYADIPGSIYSIIYGGAINMHLYDDEILRKEQRTTRNIIPGLYKIKREGKSPHNLHSVCIKQLLHAHYVYTHKLCTRSKMET